jgi:hypothetical protein
MHCLPRHPVLSGHLRDRCAALQDFQHRPGTAAPRRPAPPAHPAPFAAISPLIAAKRHAYGKPGNLFGVSPTYRNYCQPATGTASAKCRPGTRTTVSSIYRTAQSTSRQVWRGLGSMSLGLSLAPALPATSCSLHRRRGPGRALAPHPNDPASPRIRRAGAMAITVKSTGCWDIPALEELPVRRAPRGARRDCGRGGSAAGTLAVRAAHAETCSPGASLKDGPAPFGTPVPPAQATDNSH